MNARAPTHTPSRATRQFQLRARTSVSPSKASRRARSSKASRVTERDVRLSTVTARFPRRSPMRCTTSARAVSGSCSWTKCKMLFGNAKDSLTKLISGMKSLL